MVCHHGLTVSVATARCHNKHVKPLLSSSSHHKAAGASHLVKSSTTWSATLALQLHHQHHNIPPTEYRFTTVPPSTIFPFIVCRHPRHQQHIFILTRLTTFANPNSKMAIKWTSERNEKLLMLVIGGIQVDKEKLAQDWKEQYRMSSHFIV